MNKDNTKRKRRRGRRVVLVVVLVFVAAVAAFALFFYRQLGSLFSPARYRPQEQIVETQDIRVQQGNITKILNLYGTIQPDQEARLGFRTAQGRVFSVPVQAGQDVVAGQVLIELDRTALERDMAEARADLLEAERELDALLEDEGATRQMELQEALTQANAALDQAVSALKEFQAGAENPDARRTEAAAELADARDTLAELREGKQRREQIDYLQWQYNLAEVEHGPYVLIRNPSERDLDLELILRNEMLDKLEALEQAKLQYEMDVRAAEHVVELKERTLRDIEGAIAAGSFEVEVKKREAAVRKAEARVQEIRADLGALEENPLDVEVAKARASVLKSQGEVSDAEAALAEAALVAPFDGVVEEIKALPNAVVSPGVELVKLYSASSFHVLARVNEIDVVYLSPGQSVSLRFDAVPDMDIEGVLGDIPSYGTYQQGVSMFDVRVEFDPINVPLRAGMGANIKVPLFRKEGVIIVPVMAIQIDAEGTFVMVVENGRMQRREVYTGISDGVNIEVIRGLEKGEVVRTVLQGPMQR